MPKILFLAEFAPTNDVYPKPKEADKKFYAETYHFKIYEVLKKNKYDFYSTPDIEFLINNSKDIDLVWSVYNRIGFRNSEIFIQSLCEYLGVEYIGAAPNVRALVEDKSMSKQLAEHLGIETANWVVASKKYPLSSQQPFSGPYFVKPQFGSASISINETSICDNWKSVIEKANEYFKDDIDVIVEEFIDGHYYGVPIMNSFKGLPIVGVPHVQFSNKSGNVITYNQKRFIEPGMQRFASFDVNLNKMLTHYTKKYFLNMQPCDYARIDFIVEKNTGIPYFLEVNVLMNLGFKSGFIESFLLNDKFNSYEDIIIYILNLGLHRVL